jgi:hypothetical protein
MTRVQRVFSDTCHAVEIISFHTVDLWGGERGGGSKAGKIKWSRNELKAAEILMSSLLFCDKSRPGDSNADCFAT